MPRSVLTNPPDEAIVTAVVVLKFATISSLPAEISKRPAGERIKAIDRLVVINGCRALVMTFDSQESSRQHLPPNLGFPKQRSHLSG